MARNNDVDELFKGSPNSKKPEDDKSKECDISEVSKVHKKSQKRDFIPHSELETKMGIGNELSSHDIDENDPNDKINASTNKMLVDLVRQPVTPNPTEFKPYSPPINEQELEEAKEQRKEDKQSPKTQKIEEIPEAIEVGEGQGLNLIRNKGLVARLELVSRDLDSFTIEETLRKKGTQAAIEYCKERGWTEKAEELANKDKIIKSKSKSRYEELEREFLSRDEYGNLFLLYQKIKEEEKQKGNSEAARDASEKAEKALRNARIISRELEREARLLGEKSYFPRANIHLRLSEIYKIIRRDNPRISQGNFREAERNYLQAIKEWYSYSESFEEFSEYIQDILEIANINGMNRVIQYYDSKVSEREQKKDKKKPILSRLKNMISKKS